MTTIGTSPVVNGQMGGTGTTSAIVHVMTMKYHENVAEMITVHLHLGDIKNK